jgi:hypothetical protein
MPETVGGNRVFRTDRDLSKDEAIIRMVDDRIDGRKIA